jgi:hypothetical protein
MDAIALPLAFPAILTSIRKFVAYFNSTDTRVENLLRKCRILERGVSQLAESVSQAESDPLIDEIMSECSQVVKSMEVFMTECGRNNSSIDPIALSKTARLKLVWKEDDMKALLARLDDCRANVQLFLIMTIPCARSLPLSDTDQVTAILGEINRNLCKVPSHL